VQVLLVDQSHQLQILVRLATAGVVVRRARKAQQLTLLGNAQPAVARRDPAPPLSSRTGQLFFEPVQLHVQLADLAVQLLDHRLTIVLRVVLWLLKDPRDVRQEPTLPLADQVAVHAKLARQLAQRLVVVQRRQGHSRLEPRFIPLPHALLAHGRELLKWLP
jgi:hypothetical protein